MPVRIPKSPVTKSPVSSPKYPLIPDGECYAKTVGNEGGASVYEHLRATCLVYRELKRRWMGFVREGYFFPEGEWLAAYHDIGKMTPSFQQKIYDAIQKELPWKNAVYESNGGHARNSAIVLQSYGKLIATLAGGHHHGAYIELQIEDKLEKEELGGEAWQSQRKALLKRLQRELELAKTLDLERVKAMDMLILGSTILSDWISSSMDLPWGCAVTEEKVRSTVQGTGFYPHPVVPNRTFSEIFGFECNGLQRTMLQNVVPGGIYVVESGMGSGKTEAALGLAYALLEQKKADGIYFALPTRLTSEKIYDRLNGFLERVLDPTQEETGAILIHGDSWLQWSLREPVPDGVVFHGVDSWFQSKKRALLAPYGAGTIDQALLSVIRVRHQALRAFALVGKVVILDEIHSYDAYTANLLRVLIGKLRSWGCTVILLSATLTKKACCEFAQIAESELTDLSYPRILIHDGTKVQVLPLEAGAPAQVAITMESDEEKAMEEVLERASRGEQVLWIENTVADVQRIYRRFAALACGIEVGIIHSRFSSIERGRREGYWVEILGKHGQEKRVQKGRILVATQVLEQSVDVDADFLVTRVAPADFVFQRLGRLWRHERDRPEGAERRAVLLVADEVRDPERLVEAKDAFLPYDAYCLYRTVEALGNRTKLTIPTDIRPVLEAVYEERYEEGDLATLKAETETKRKDLEQHANLAKAEVGAVLPDDERFGTRYDDGDIQVQVILLKRGNGGYDVTKVLRLLERDQPLSLEYKTPAERLAITRELMGHIIKVSEKNAPSQADFPAAFLSDFLWTGNDGFCPVRIAYVDDTGRLLTQACNPVETWRGTLYYTRAVGYEVRKKAKGVLE